MNSSAHQPIGDRSETTVYLKRVAAANCNFIALLCILGLATLSGCHVLAPKQIRVPAHGSYNVSPEMVEINDAPIEIGRPVACLDTVGWIFGIPSKILLWDRRVDNHRITESTVAQSVQYLNENQLAHVKVRFNQYAPLQDWQRLKKNKTVAWPYRYTFGVLALGGEAIFPGRLFGGDHFNPFTQTAHIYSDLPAIALHELAHAKDFSRRRFPGTYGLAYLVFPTYHETIASRDVIGFLYEHESREGIIEANRVLYPAYGTYVGNGLGWIFPNVSTPLYYGMVVAGHVNGRLLSLRVDEHLELYRNLAIRRGRVKLASDKSLEALPPESSEKPLAATSL